MPFDPFAHGRAPYLGSLDLEVGFAAKKISDESYDQDDLTKLFIRVRTLHSLTQYFRPSPLKGPSLVIVSEAYLFPLEFSKPNLCSGATSDNGYPEYQSSSCG